MYIVLFLWMSSAKSEEQGYNENERKESHHTLPNNNWLHAAIIRFCFFALEFLRIDTDRTIACFPWNLATYLKKEVKTRLSKVSFHASQSPNSFQAREVETLSAFLGTNSFLY